MQAKKDISKPHYLRKDLSYSVLRGIGGSMGLRFLAYRTLLLPRRVQSLSLAVWYLLMQPSLHLTVIESLAQVVWSGSGCGSTSKRWGCWWELTPISANISVFQGHMCAWHQLGGPDLKGRLGMLAKYCPGHICAWHQLGGRFTGATRNASQTQARPHLCLAPNWGAKFTGPIRNASQTLPGHICAWHQLGVPIGGGRFTWPIRNASQTQRCHICAWHQLGGPIYRGD